LIFNQFIADDGVLEKVLVPNGAGLVLQVRNDESAKDIAANQLFRFQQSVTASLSADGVILIQAASEAARPLGPIVTMTGFKDQAERKIFVDSLNNAPSASYAFTSASSFS